MSVEKPLDLSVFRPPQTDEEQIPYIAIEMGSNQDVDNINVLRNAIDMFSVPQRLLRAASAVEHDLSRPFEEPRLIFEGEIVIEEETGAQKKKPGDVLDLSKAGANCCAVSERPRPFVRYLFREERLVRVECAGVKQDSVPTLTRRWAHIIAGQLERPGEVPEMLVGPDGKAQDEAGRAPIRPGDAELDCG